MSRDRGLLALSRVGEFSRWLADGGWELPPPNTTQYEVLRAKHKSHNTIVLYARANATKHCTVGVYAINMVKRFIKETRG